MGGSGPGFHQHKILGVSPHTKINLQGLEASNMCHFGTPVRSYLSNISEMKSKRSDPYNDQQRDIILGYLTLKPPLIMLLSKNKLLQPMPRSPKIKTCMSLNLGAQAPGFYLGASVPYQDLRFNIRA